jgi:DNA-directed RNA polymerase subunit RPC12/RpoP
MTSAEGPRCVACGDEMELTVLIPPFGSPYALKIYNCPRCGRSQDYLVEPSAKAA